MCDERYKDYSIEFEGEVIEPIISHTHDCRGCYFEQRKLCERDKPPCGLQHWGVWHIWKLKEG